MHPVTLQKISNFSKNTIPGQSAFSANSLSWSRDNVEVTQSLKADSTSSSEKEEWLMYKMVLIRLTLTALAAFFLACASTPPWGDMSQDEIAAWKADGLDAAEAQAWKKKGFTAESAKAWHSRGFDLEATQAWMKEGFDADEAKRWKTAGFSISQAAANRGKGLTPIEAHDETKPSATSGDDASKSDNGGDEQTSTTASDSK
ncbi:hypothetical protein MK280_03840 [Myxococcota bacterium]|nr:hypothetical protein [Myxococcota bacterium]